MNSTSAGRWLAFVATVLLAVSPAGGRAESFEVDPVTLTIAPGAKTADVTVRNAGTHAIRFSIHVYRWEQTPSEEMKLVDTDDLLAFPEIFDVPAHGSQRIRLGLASPRTAPESAFRVFFNEVPPPDPHLPHGAALTIVTHVSIPVFVPSLPLLKSDVAMVHVTQDGRAVSVDLVNRGNGHATAEQLHVTLRDAAGRELWTTDQSTWYLLAGAHRTIRVNPPASVCRSAHSVAVRYKNASDDAPWNGASCTK